MILGTTCPACRKNKVTNSSSEQTRSKPCSRCDKIEQPNHQYTLPIMLISDQAGKDKKSKGAALLILEEPLEDAL